MANRPTKVETDGDFIHWYDRPRYGAPVAEMAYIELLQETVGIQNIQGGRYEGNHGTALGTGGAG